MLHFSGWVPENHNMPYGADAQLQQHLRSLVEMPRANPDLTGWPIWLVSDEFGEKSRPYLFQDCWEQFVYQPRSPSPGGWGHLDFMIFDPKGAFFLRRALHDDMQNTVEAETKGKTVEPLIQILRVAEALTVGQAFARSMGCNDDATLNYLFHWTGMKDRELANWSDPMWAFYFQGTSQQDDASGKVSLPIAL